MSNFTLLVGFGKTWAFFFGGMEVAVFFSRLDRWSHRAYLVEKRAQDTHDHSQGQIRLVQRFKICLVKEWATLHENGS